MKILEDMILERGIAVNEDILKVDSFVNHQVDPELMKNIGDEFAEHFKRQGYHKGCNHRKFRHCSGTDDGSCPECTDADLKKAAF